MNDAESRADSEHGRCDVADKAGQLEPVGELPFEVVVPPHNGRVH